MVIGNGFFTDTRQDAVKEMQERSHCRVEHCPFPTIGNIDYYISEKGDLYGMQNIQGKQLTRLKKSVKYKSGYSARLQESPRREAWVPLQVLVYCAFTLKRWEPTVQLDFKNGNPYDVRPDNLQPKQKEEHPEWTEAMEERQWAYDKEYTRICYSTAFYIGIPIEDSKDIVSQTFIELCTTSNNPSIHNTDEFIGLWHKMSRRRAIDFYHHYGKRFDMEIYDTLLEIKGNRDAPYERDLFHLQPGTKRATYLRMWAEGNTPTEIAKECGCSLSTVSASISRSIQFLQRYFKKVQGL